MGASPARGAPGGGGLILPGWRQPMPGALRGESWAYPAWRGLPLPGVVVEGGGRASSCPGGGNPLSGVVGRDTHLILPSCGQSPARGGGVVWEGSAVGREGGGPVLPGGVLELPWDAEGRPALGGCILTKGSSCRGCCRGDTSSPRCREGPDPGCCWKG